MKRKRKQKRPHLRTISLWDFPRAQKALPYLRSVAHSLRDHWLEVQDKRLEIARLSAKKGRPDRVALLAGAKASEEKAQAEDRFADALNELVGIDVYLFDPVRGLAFIPFQKEDELAWFVFDLFDKDHLKTWRFHKDPLDMRRPLAEVAGDVSVGEGGTPSLPDP